MSITNIHLLKDLKGPWADLQFEMLGSSAPITIPDIYPFLSIADLKRLIWMYASGDVLWAPDRIFLCIRNADGSLRPLEFHWMSSLPDPMTTRAPSPLLIDEAGNKKPISPTILSGMLLEDALAPEIQATGTLPVITVIPLAALAPSLEVELTPQLFGGFYQLYFPWLTEPSQVLDASKPTPALTAAYASCVPYIEDRIGRVSVIQSALATGVGGESVHMNTMVRIRWSLPVPSAKPVSLETTFYSMQANTFIPFLRYLPIAKKGQPILKLGLKEDGTPIITDEQILTKYLNQPTPNNKSAVIVARVPVVSANMERGSAFTIYMFEDGTSDITLEVPQRGKTYTVAAALEAERLLPNIIRGLGFPADTRAVLRELHATYVWTHPNPKAASPLTKPQLTERVEALTPFLTMSKDAEAGRDFSFVWSAVSNYDSENAQFAFITQMVLEKEQNNDDDMIQMQYLMQLQKRFGITQIQAEELMERWYERRGKAVAPAAGVGAGTFAVPKHNIGAHISIAGSFPSYYVDVQGVSSYVELQMIMSVVGVLLGAKPSELILKAPVTIVQKQEELVELVNAQHEDDITAGGVPVDGGFDAETMAFLAAQGFDMGTALEEPAAAAEPAAAPLPNVDTIVNTINEECSAIRWKPGDPPVAEVSQYYITRLQELDATMFKYKIEGGRKSYARSCQTIEGRQPDIMTLEEYARVKQCYKDTVQFVDLPPQKPEDLDIPWPTGRYTDAATKPYAMFNDVTKKPIWIVYGYNNKTDPSKFNYLMCSVLWCVRDNLPLLQHEFDGTQGRGFVKPPHTCPFCGGKVIGVLGKPQPGESVIVRASKEGKDLHRFIGVMSTVHPDGSELPCCSVVPKLLKTIMEEKKNGTLKYGLAYAPSIAEKSEIISPQEITEAPDRENTYIDYTSIFAKMKAQYIASGEKSSKAGSITTMTPALDKFFGQNSVDSITTVGVRRTFRDKVMLFVRVVTDTRIRHPGLSFFAGLAPLIGATSSEQARTFMLRNPIVRAFEAANYGTLVNEFAARSNLTDAQIEGALPKFATTYGYDIQRARPHVVRLFKAWNAFQEYCLDDLIPKKIRHFEHLLASPGIMMPMGLLLVVIEQIDDRITIRCPAFGIPTAPIYKDVPIAFLLHNVKLNIWEPVVLYNGTDQAIIWFNETHADMLSLPEKQKRAIFTWLQEWRSAKDGCGRPAPPPHVWTPARDTADLPTLSFFRKNMVDGYKMVALVRDRSNRLAGGLLLKERVKLLYVPFLDDGSLGVDLPTVYETALLPNTPIKEYIEAYKGFGIMGLRPVRVLQRGNNIVGFQVAAGTMIPCGLQPLSANTTGLPVVPVDEFVWERDALILSAPNSGARGSTIMNETTASVEEQLAEAYQHLRLSFSAWLRRDKHAIPFKTNMDALMTKALPLFEKRRRMDILLYPVIASWLLPERSTKRVALPVLRTDCLTLGSSAECAAKGACRWSEGRCLIHAPYQKEDANPVQIMVSRLSDEILRYPEARSELFDGSVSAIRAPRGVARIGNEVYMAMRQRESTDNVLKRLGLFGHGEMTFPEELLQFEGADIEVLKGLPPAWVSAGFQLPTPDPELSKAEIFAALFGMSIEQLQTMLDYQRQKRGLPADAGFTWSQQDFALLATLYNTNFAFVHATTAGEMTVDRLITPEGGLSDDYFIMWGPHEYLVTRKGTQTFSLKVLPFELQQLLASA